MPDVPPFNDMLWVTLRVLISLGGSASISELDQAVIAAAGALMSSVWMKA